MSTTQGLTIQQKIEKVLKDVRNVSADVIGLMVVDINGLPMASYPSDSREVEELGTNVVFLLGAAERMATDLLKDPFKQVSVKSEGKCVFINAINQDNILAIMADGAIKEGLIHYWLKPNIPRLKSILDGTDTPQSR